MFLDNFRASNTPHILHDDQFFLVLSFTNNDPPKRDVLFERCLTQQLT